jgi:flagellar biosynthesis/type III secretory pathway chaperone
LIKEYKAAFDLPWNSFLYLKHSERIISAMEVWADELAKAIQIECEVLNELSNIAEKKTDIIIKGDAILLDNILNYEQPLLMQLENIEQARQKILKQVAMEGLTLSEIAAKTDDAGKNLFLSYLSSFNNISSKLKRSNDLNNKLVRSRLDLYEQLRGIQNNQTYVSGGKALETSAKAVLIDKKI